MTALTHTYDGPAYEASQPFKYPSDWFRSPESERISGTFRIVEEDETGVILGNGETPELFYRVMEWDWEEARAAA